eukprot:gb/GECG01011951.1/.p1 GENE.gb/GECG01011951.1/~~gb/GECG01011951.1/.p1  ORF type:complete len:177 (+),score=14.70 gb/GECG01011951.1/:1-531(+)
MHCCIETILSLQLSVFTRLQASVRLFIQLGTMDRTEIPVVNIAALTGTSSGGESYTSQQKQCTAEEIGRACDEVGFFYVMGHGVDPNLLKTLFQQGRDFFAKPVEYKDGISMHNSNVFRGYFRLGDELTNKKPDWKVSSFVITPLDQQLLPFLHFGIEWCRKGYISSGSFLNNILM